MLSVVVVVVVAAASVRSPIDSNDSVSFSGAMCACAAAAPPLAWRRLGSYLLGSAVSHEGR